MSKTDQSAREFISAEEVREHFLPILDREERRKGRTPEEAATDEAARIVRRVSAHARAATSKVTSSGS